MEYLEGLVKTCTKLYECNEFTARLEAMDQEMKNLKKEVDLFLATGDDSFLKSINLEKENVEPTAVTNKRRVRGKKPALADISENSLSKIQAVAIKQEKISSNYESRDDTNLQVEEMPAPSKLPPRKKKIKTEKIDLPKRSTRTRTRQLEASSEVLGDSRSTRSSKTSDVIIQNPTIPTIDISDTEKDSENSTADSHGEFRSTRTKTKQKKRNRSNSVEQPAKQRENKKTKSDSGTAEENDNTAITEYQDAVSAVENNKEQQAGATYIASSKNSRETYVASEKSQETYVAPSQDSNNATYVSSSNDDNGKSVASSLNLTMVVEKPKIVTKDKETNIPQDKNEEVVKTPPKATNKNGSKQVFSPFERTPLKKKIEAFEKLETDARAIPVRVTRSKKNVQKNDKKPDETETRPIAEKKKSYTEKERIFTPISKFIPKGCSTSKINKLDPNCSNASTSNESLLSVKSASALKASQAEFREREKRRQKKEREAMRKREALLQAQTEEKRRKREEKQQRAQQQREILERETQKLLEVQRMKEEKHREALAERERKLQKQREEAERKRMMAKTKVSELLKEKEEATRMAEQKKYAEMKAALEKQGEMAKMALKQKMERAQQPESTPIYMKTKAPLLPTTDCYDSDDPEYGTHKPVDPEWSKGEELREMQLAMSIVGETMKNTFFCRQAQTPDLQEVFELIDPRKLKRTSSAVWRKPPRYTLMPGLEDTIESNEESD